MHNVELCFIGTFSYWVGGGEGGREINRIIAAQYGICFMCTLFFFFWGGGGGGGGVRVSFVGYADINREISAKYGIPVWVRFLFGEGG